MSNTYYITATGPFVDHVRIQKLCFTVIAWVVYVHLLDMSQWSMSPEDKLADYRIVEKQASLEYESNHAFNKSVYFGHLSNGQSQQIIKLMIANPLGESLDLSLMKPTFLVNINHTRLNENMDDQVVQQQPEGGFTRRHWH
ncbi:uncharacterized protein MELLADRAFT_59894 [Melampsora larici-populina 98AG31]|uniref:Uncharacterized protein n=1 Tax=Melampsora larici-populina (strain 98AG31 / pathotype 3-4-7) TaxID=747676 RepID=F4R970_MELLP|nr:uncharacterized protein MELLADRAFT_59894 [Melampsora larici-populina 98AG31]EGG11204.1 hypothetical protein MELLADRAFT_59894 [Melampsora larici-populina 98AG31]